MKKSNKLTCLLLTLVMCLSLIACGEKQTNSNSVVTITNSIDGNIQQFNISQPDDSTWGENRIEKAVSSGKSAKANADGVDEMAITNIRIIMSSGEYFYFDDANILAGDSVELCYDEYGALVITVSNADATYNVYESTYIDNQILESTSEESTSEEITSENVSAIVTIINNIDGIIEEFNISQPEDSIWGGNRIEAAIASGQSTTADASGVYEMTGTDIRFIMNTGEYLFFDNAGIWAGDIIELHYNEYGDLIITVSSNGSSYDIYESTYFNQQTSESTSVLPTPVITVTNNIDGSIEELNISQPDDITWGDNRLEAAISSGQSTLANATDINLMTITDVRILMNSGEYFYFDDAVVMEGDTITLRYDEYGNLVLTVSNGNSSYDVYENTY